MTNGQGSGRHHTRDGEREVAGRLRGARLQAAWGAWLSRVRWEDFVTLTFHDTRQQGLSGARADVEALKWCGVLGWVSRRPIGYAYAAELSPGGRWHVHALVVGLPERCWPVAKGTWQQRNGYVDRQRVADGRGVALYTTKQAAERGTVVFSDTLERYMTKGSEARPVALIGGDVR